ncbi:MAG: chromosomal replication initiator protein DnaA, partial [Actinobacteria bacterium]|nr:chromosomal replication initiator protein DnaA [Actinomycetota bacterium]
MSLHEVPDVPVWSAVLDHLLTDDRITPQLHGFLNLAVPQGVMGGTLYLDVPNDLTAAQMNKRMRAPIMEALTQVQGHDPEVSTFRVVVNPELIDSHLSSPSTADDAPAPAAPMSMASLSPISETPVEPPAPASRQDTRLNPKYTFDNFVIGQSNRFAHAAAVAVAEAPAKAYNPLFIYGDSGLGKTHLLHAIGDYAASMYAGIRVRYVSSEEFTNDFINSIANNRGSAFQARYRDVDILLIDDIQFLQGRAETQEAFFHTFNTLHDHDKQVVITSDLPPKQLTGFEDRMRSRFEWGLITDVQAPDLETRIAILRKKAQSERLLIPDEVLEYIATVVSSNIRELEGALIRVSAFASLNRSTLDMTLAQTVLRDIIDQDDANVVSPTDIITATAQYFKLSVDDLYGSSRSQAVATARQIAMYLCRERTSLSLPK